MRTWLLLVALVAACRAADPDPDVPGAKFNKAELEAILKKEHSDRVSNIYDSENDIQYTWDVENQVLCPGVDGTCSKTEL